MAQSKVFAISDLFAPARGKSVYTRAYADAHSGPYPVYSASLAAPLCHVDSFDHEGTFLTWTTNGYGGRVQIISGKFSINGYRGIFFPKTTPVPDLNYLKHILEPVLIDLAVGRVVLGLKNEYTKVAPEVAANAVISLPTTKAGRIDLKKIDKAALKLKRVEKLQKGLEKIRDEILEAEISVHSSHLFTTLSLGDESYFSLKIGERVLKKDALEKGIPVYSANVTAPFAYVAESNLSDFGADSILWGIDGNFDWNRIKMSVKFASTDHCGRMQLKSKLLDPEFVYYYLQSTRHDYGFDRVFRANLENVRKLVTIKVPIKKNGDFDLDAQKKIAKRYRDIGLLKMKTSAALDFLCKAKLDLAV